MRKLLFFLIAAVFIISLANLWYENVPAFALEKKRMISGNRMEEKEQQHLIKVMTYNIHRGINKNNQLDLDGIAEVIKGTDPDIVALQEVERFSIRTGFKDQIKYLADKLSMNYAYGKSINILNGQYGNAILSKYPVEEYEVKPLPSEVENRTLLQAVLNINGSRISIYNTHLGLNRDERDKQVTEIMNITSTKEKFILAGDFNSAPDKLGAVTRRLKDSASYDEKNYERPTFENEDIAERIDYVFASHEFSIMGYEVLKSEASDHYPVISILKVPN